MDDFVNAPSFLLPLSQGRLPAKRVEEKQPRASGLRRAGANDASLGASKAGHAKSAPGAADRLRRSEKNATDWIKRRDAPPQRPRLGRRAAPRSGGFGGEPSFSGMVLILCHLRIAPSRPAPAGRSACGLIARLGAAVARVQAGDLSLAPAQGRPAGRGRSEGRVGNGEARSPPQGPHFICPSLVRRRFGLTACAACLRCLYFPRDGLIFG